MNVYTGTGVKLAIAEEIEESTTREVTLSAPWDTVIHQGWVAVGKGNTIPAFFLTKENGYNWAECDVRFSSDGVPVLIHDPSVTDGTTTLTVSQSTAQELQALVLGTTERFGDLKIPTLAQLLEMARLIGLNILLDVKAGSAGNMAALAQTVLASGWSSHVVYMVGSATNAAAVQAVDKNASFDFVSNISSADELPELADYQALLTGGNTVGFDFNASVIASGGSFPPDILTALRAAGLSVSFWNVTSSNCSACMDAGPLRLTKHNGADSTDLDAQYLKERTFW